MRTLRLIRWIAFAGIALMLAAIAAFAFAPGVRARILPRSEGTSIASAADTVSVPSGGPFELTDEKGPRITDADYRGRWMLVFFGYTNCPDEYPLTLQKMATTLQDLGPLAGRVAPLFVTVDPKRDTPERLTAILRISTRGSPG
jgi:cytochrome oxidase Cu insertion factor (SCO1/SenC/PrrC family)